MTKCTTHHHACDCREENFRELEQQLAELREAADEVLSASVSSIEHRNGRVQTGLWRLRAVYDALREEKWIAVSDQWPYDDCDVKLRDGSILRNVIPQSDRDFCWQSPFGEVFICEFSVTHWTGHRMVRNGR